MAKKRKFRIYCHTEEKHIWVDSENTPTECPNNVGHVIHTEKTTLENDEFESDGREIRLVFNDRYDNHQRTRRTNWESMGLFIFRGTDTLGWASMVKFITWVEKSSSPAYIRIYDETNGNIIAETSSFNHKTPQIVTAVISNLPSDEAIFEIQMRSTDDDDYAYLSYMTMQF